MIFGIEGISKESDVLTGREGRILVSRIRQVAVVAPSRLCSSGKGSCDLVRVQAGCLPGDIERKEGPDLAFAMGQLRYLLNQSIACLAAAWKASTSV
jgi:hypothetical protein